MVNPYALAGVSGPQFGALVYSAAGGQNVGTGAVLAFDSEAYDVTGWHDNSSNNSRLTVPTGVTLVRMTSNYRTTANNALLEHRKGGSTFVGCGRADSGGTNLDETTNAFSAIFSVTAGDYLETFANQNNTIGTARADNTWQSVEVIDSSVKRALAKKTGNQSLSAGATVTVTWDAEEYDTDGFHDNSTNNSRLTAPSTGRYRVTANLTGSSVSGQMVLTMLKNGSSARGLAARDCDTLNEENLNAASSVLELTAGDYIEVQAFSTNASNVVAGDSSWFAMESIPSARKCCTVYKSGNQSITGATNTIVAFGAELYDDATMHDNTTNNSRLVVPSGCTRARPSFGLKTPSQSGGMVCYALKNGSTYSGAPRFQTDTGGTDNLSAVGAWVDAVPGDYFELEFYSALGLTLGTDNETWFCLECE